MEIEDLEARQIYSIPLSGSTLTSRAQVYKAMDNSISSTTGLSAFKSLAISEPPAHGTHIKVLQELAEREIVPVSIDYTAQYRQTGERPANFIRHNLDVESRFPGYPRLNRLDRLKRDLVKTTAHNPLFIPFHFNPYFPSSLREILGSHNKFDAILLNVPKGVRIQDLYGLRIDQICHLPSFLFLLIPQSTSANLEEARALIQHWGYRRAEDIVWIKSNTQSLPMSLPVNAHGSLFVNAKEHCLMCIKGTVRRATDGHIIHCNVDTDVIIADEFDLQGRRQKPEDLYRTIENFCQGLRRLEIFCSRPRPGWVSLDRKFVYANYHPFLYSHLWSRGHLMPQIPLIDELRPRSPHVSDPGQSKTPSSAPLLVPRTYQSKSHVEDASAKGIILGLKPKTFSAAEEQYTSIVQKTSQSYF